MLCREWFTGFYSTRYRKVWACSKGVLRSPSLLPLCCVYPDFWKCRWKLLAWHIWIIFLHKIRIGIGVSRARGTGHAASAVICLAKHHLSHVHLLPYFWGPQWPLLVLFMDPKTWLLGPSPSAFIVLAPSCCRPRQGQFLIPLSITAWGSVAQGVDLKLLGLFKPVVSPD